MPVSDVLEILYRLISADYGVPLEVRSYVDFSLRFYEGRLSLVMRIPLFPFVLPALWSGRQVFKAGNFCNVPCAARSPLATLRLCTELMRTLGWLTGTSPEDIIKNSNTKVAFEVRQRWGNGGLDLLKKDVETALGGSFPWMLEEVLEKLDSRSHVLNEILVEDGPTVSISTKEYRRTFNELLQDIAMCGNKCPICFQDLGRGSCLQHNLSMAERVSRKLDTNSSVSSLVKGGSTPAVVANELPVTHPGCHTCNRKTAELRVTRAMFGSKQFEAVSESLLRDFTKLNVSLRM
jgi:hypothetical protein